LTFAFLSCESLEPWKCQLQFRGTGCLKLAPKFVLLRHATQKEGAPLLARRMRDFDAFRLRETRAFGLMVATEVGMSR
jgi:hypothetical protein